MSLLNDALRKNRTDSQGASPSAPRRLPISDRATQAIQPRIWLIVIVGALLSAGIFGGYLYQTNQGAGRSFQTVPVINEVDSVSENTLPPARISPAIALESPAPEAATAPPDPDSSPATLSAAEPIHPPTVINAPTPAIFTKKSLKQLTKAPQPTVVKQAPEQKSNISIQHRRPNTVHLYAKARRYQQQGQLDQAMDMYNEILQMDSRHFNARFNLISVYLQKGLPDKAYPLAADLHRQWPENPEIMLNLAAAGIGVGEASKGLALLNQARRLPDAPIFEIYLHQGIANRHLGRTETAISYYRRAEQLRPEDPRLLFNLAVAFDQQQDYKEAVKYYLAYVKANHDGNSLNQHRVEQRIRQLQTGISTPATGDLTP